MQHFVVNLLHIGAWIFGVIFLFAIIGFIAVIKWIANLFRKTESAVQTGMHNVEETFHHHDQ
ncbi:MAG: hypothetical protein ACXWNK_12015 [Vulcanimicrobiaceae bacterium]